MATERLSVRQTREILRQKWSLGRTHREVAQSLGISNGAVGTTVLRARAAGLDWAQVDTLSDEALQARVYGPPTLLGRDFLDRFNVAIDAASGVVKLTRRVTE